MNIITAKSINGTEISCCPERGGIITSMKSRKGTEILYMDHTTLRNPEVNVKGGIPILFPNAGGFPDGLQVAPELSGLKRHGFARESAHWRGTLNRTGFWETLTNNNETLKLFPFRFTLSVEGHIEEDSSWSIIQNVFNPDMTRTMPISMGLHPYFRVPEAEKKDIEFKFPGKNVVKKNLEKWTRGTAISIKNPELVGECPIRVGIPGLGWLSITASGHYERIWFWSLPDKNFICIEPVMRDKGAIATNPVKIRPNQTTSAKLSISLIE